MLERAGDEAATDLLHLWFKLAEFYADSILRQADLQISPQLIPAKKAGGDLPQSPP